jgi:peptide/nickel transport system ATP-binding protein
MIWEFLFITHDLGVIAELADKVIVMYKGKIVEQGSVWDIFNDPKHPYTKGLISLQTSIR